MLGSRTAASLLLVFCVPGCATSPRGGEARVVPNDNRRPAGELRDGVLTLHLDVLEARWFPDGDDGPGEIVRVFAQVGGVPQNPGPLIRVPVGTHLRLTLRNPLSDSTLVVHGLHPRPGLASDTVQVAPGSSRDVSFTAGEPGTYFYWGTTTHAAIDERHPMERRARAAMAPGCQGREGPRPGAARSALGECRGRSWGNCRLRVHASNTRSSHARHTFAVERMDHQCAGRRRTQRARRSGCNQPTLARDRDDP